MKATLRLFVTASIAICLTTLLSAKQKEKKWGTYDRLFAIQGFLDAVYPDLRHTEGLLILRAEELHAVGGNRNHVEVVPCKPGSGIILADKPGQTVPPNCLGLPVPVASDFLSISVSYGSKPYPIGDFDVQGSFVGSSSEHIASEIVKHPDWTDGERIQAVRGSGARFGPDHKDEFIRALPHQAILEYTGCKLLPSSAEFIAARMEGEPGHDYAIVQWRVLGTRQVGPSKRRNQRCVARFEPFDAKLLSIAEQ